MNLIDFRVHCAADLQMGWVSLVAQLVKNLPAIQETPVRFLGWEDLLEKEWATHYSVLGLPWWLRWLRIRLQSRRPGFDTCVGKIPWGREQLLTPVFWPEEFHGRGAWQATVHGIAKSRTCLSGFHFHTMVSGTC